MVDSSTEDLVGRSPTSTKNGRSGSAQLPRTPKLVRAKVQLAPIKRTMFSFRKIRSYDCTRKNINNVVHHRVGRLSLSVTEEVSLEIRYRVVKRAATLATGPRPQKLAADRDS